MTNMSQTGLPTLTEVILGDFFSPQHDVMSLIVVFNLFTISISPTAFNSHWGINAKSSRLLAKPGELATLAPKQITLHFCLDLEIAFVLI